MLINRTVIYRQLMTLIISTLSAIPIIYGIKQVVILGLEVLNITVSDEHRYDIHVFFENIPLITIVIIYTVCNVLLYRRNNQKFELKVNKNK